jgi:hypothetical protein
MILGARSEKQLSVVSNQKEQWTCMGHSLKSKTEDLFIRASKQSEKKLPGVDVFSLMQYEK